MPTAPRRSLAVLLCLLPIGTRAEPPVLRTDGLYQSEPEKLPEPHWQYFQFFADGTVRASPSTGSPEEVSKWLASTGARGVYTLHGRHLSFTTRVTFRTQKWMKKEVVELSYAGALQPDGSIDLDYENRQSGKRGSLKLRFVRHRSSGN